MNKSISKCLKLRTSELYNFIIIKSVIYIKVYKQIRVSIVVSIPPCHGGDPGSIPGRGAFFNQFYLI